MKTLLMSAALLGLMTGTAMAQPDEQYKSPIPDERTFLTNDDKFEGLTAGPGREETFYAFRNCFKIGWIKRQKMTRTEWDMAVDQMTKDCNLDPLEADEKQTIVDYLVANYGRRR